MTDYSADRSAADALDAADELSAFRDEFVIEDPDLVYFDGNSLGRLPHAAAARARALVGEEWGGRLIAGWNDGWYDAPLRAGGAIARLVGAADDEVVVCDSTSVNLFKVCASAIALRPDRTRIVTDGLNFPSDLYVLQGLAAHFGGRHEIVLVPPAGDEPDTAALGTLVDERTAVVVLSHVTFKSGYRYDAAHVTALAHDAGALVVWDLSHSAGVVPIALDAWGADFAAGCTYKYLNGGPGAPAYLYVNRAHLDRAASPIQGWFGSRAPFAFALDYEPARGIARFLAGTPPIISLCIMEAAVEVTLRAGIDAVHRKSVRQTDYLIALCDLLLRQYGFSVITPRASERRGSHVALRHSESFRIARALRERARVIPDFREPDVIRLACAPLYTSYREVWEGVRRIAAVVQDGEYRAEPDRRSGVT